MKKEKEYAKFVPSFKLLLKREDKVLILTESDAGCLDLPGGRMERGEENFPLEKLFKREIAEELGKNVKYQITGGPALQYRRFNKFSKTYALITVYEAKYIGGKIKLSPEHSEYEWFDPKKQNLKNRKFNNPEEKTAFLSYFK